MRVFPALRRWLLTLFAFGWPTVLPAHEVPSRVAVTGFVKQEGGTVRVAVRVPLEAMRDVEFPLRERGMLDLARADSTLRDAAVLWVADAITLYANDQSLAKGRVVAVRASLPSDRAFEQYGHAIASTLGAPLAQQLQIPAAQVMLDVVLEYTNVPAGARLAIEPKMAHLGVQTTSVLRLVMDGGAERAFVFTGDPGVLQLDPSWWHAVSRFVVMGGSHLLEGLDHLLFLLCLVIPVRRLRPLVGIVSAFTIAHSLTLGASALGFAPTALWFPPFVEMLIAASIVYMAIENAVGARLERRWLMAFGCGLIHGFGFSYALGESLQFAGAHLLLALAAFNVGIELAQIALLLLAVPLFSWIFSRVVAERAGVLVVSALVAHSAWHWMTERFEIVRSYQFVWPAFDRAFVVAGLRAMMGMLVVTGIAWALSGLMRRLSAGGSPRHANNGAGLGASGVTARATSALVLSLVFAGWAGAPRLADAQSAPRTSTMTGVYTAAQANKGKQVFAGSCSGCHTVASHSGEAFTSKWVGRSLADFFNYVSGLMPKSAPATLTDDEYVWVTAYVLRLNGMPAGARELEADISALKMIRIDTTASGRAGANHDAALASRPAHGMSTSRLQSGRSLKGEGHAHLTMTREHVAARTENR
ncbi:MAG: HupE/UreJ family protein [Gemmatimonadaceae bacterium]|nr:HupE/UreJ family protein [Gemmatimonadaceae bacterium]